MVVMLFHIFSHQPSGMLQSPFFKIHWIEWWHGRRQDSCKPSASHMGGTHFESWSKTGYPHKMFMVFLMFSRK